LWFTQGHIARTGKRPSQPVLIKNSGLKNGKQRGKGNNHKERDCLRNKVISSRIGLCEVREE
jgi:hypothetical protein